MQKKKHEQQMMLSCWTELGFDHLVAGHGSRQPVVEDADLKKKKKKKNQS